MHAAKNIVDPYHLVQRAAKCGRRAIHGMPAEDWEGHCTPAKSALRFLLGMSPGLEIRHSNGVTV